MGARDSGLFGLACYVLGLGLSRLCLRGLGGSHLQYNFSAPVAS
jgi:hypothetical protein